MITIQKIVPLTPKFLAKKDKLMKASFRWGGIGQNRVSQNGRG